MSDTSRTDDSAPSLSSYPPAFVSLITTFIKRAEEAETRAHKVLVILRAKDQTVLQLQHRLEVLEKIASRLEEVMVPPLSLPPSPQSLDGDHPRSVETAVGRKVSDHPPLETLYERYPTTHQTKKEHEVQEVHNCYTRCQHLIDGLERSNCQLREALTVESRQRVKDHEEYVASLAKVTQTVKDMQADQNTSNMHTNQVVLQALQKHCLSKSIFEEVTSALGAAGDNKIEFKITDNTKTNLLASQNQTALDKEGLQKKLYIAENIQTLRNQFEEGGKNPIKRNERKKIRENKSNKTQRSSTSSYHTPPSSVSFNAKRKPRSLHCYSAALRRKNKRLRMKYKRVYEKFKESLNLCGKLQEDLICLTEQKKTKLEKDEIQRAETSTQTDRVKSSLICGSSVSDRPEKLHSSKSVHFLQGRLDAAAKVMSKQYKQIQDFQQQLLYSHTMVETLRKRLSRAESNMAGKELLGETTRQQLEDMENRNADLNEEIQELKDSLNQLRQELSSQVERNNKLEKERENSEEKYEQMRRTMETKLCSLSSTLQQKDEFSDRARTELETKLCCVKEQFVAQVTEASSRLVAADSKIQELYLAIETFLKLLFTLKKCSYSSPELSPSSQAQAVQMASDILQLAPLQIQTILHTSRNGNHQVNKWIRECNRLVHNKVFAKDLGNFLLDAVLEAKIS